MLTSRRLAFGELMTRVAVVVPFRRWHKPIVAWGRPEGTCRKLADRTEVLVGVEMRAIVGEANRLGLRNRVVWQTVPRVDGVAVPYVGGCQARVFNSLP